MSIRVRYAPSPTGLQHIGGIRTAWFNYCFARANKGIFILRIEDTDQTRYNPHALTNIYDSFTWLGITIDEGPRSGGTYAPYIQSQRTDFYNHHIQTLIQAGHAYPCFCTSERLDHMRAQQIAEKQEKQGYDGHCRHIPHDEAQTRITNGEPYVIRYRLPDNGSITVTDIILGEQSWNYSDMNPDPILIKSDGMPTYHFANIIDDHMMDITHVIRSQEWLSSLPIHIALYNAFGWNAPHFAHVPMVLGSSGKKLSKRDGATNILQFQHQGYLPHALLNYISLLGWSPGGNTEYISIAEITTIFSIDRLGKSSATFDYTKLKAFNQQYIQQLSDDDFSQYLQKSLAHAHHAIQQTNNVYTPIAMHTLLSIRSALEQRMSRFCECAYLIDFATSTPAHAHSTEILGKKLTASATCARLQATIEWLEDMQSVIDQPCNTRAERDQQIAVIDDALQSLRTICNAKPPELFMPLRLALMGSKQAPSLDNYAIIPLHDIESACTSLIAKTRDAQQKAHFIALHEFLNTIKSEALADNNNAPNDAYHTVPIPRMHEWTDEKSERTHIVRAVLAHALKDWRAALPLSIGFVLLGTRTSQQRIQAMMHCLAHPS